MNTRYQIEKSSDERSHETRPVHGGGGGVGFLKERTVGHVLVIEAKTEMEWLLNLDIQIDQVEGRRASAHVGLGRRVGRRDTRDGGVSDIVTGRVDVLKHRVGGQLPHVPVGGQEES